jgi:hypothetical protein
MTAWRPLTWLLSSMPTGTYNIASADMTAWRPSTWYLYSMPTGTYNIASADMAAWTTVTGIYYFSMPVMLVSASSFSTQAGMTTLDLHSITLLAPAVNQVLADLVVSLTIRGSVKCTVNLSGTDAAPTGQGLTDKATLIAAGWTVTTN